MNLGNRLKKAREEGKLSQKQVAEMLNISNAVLSNYERNHRDPNTLVLKKIAKLYNVSTDYLLGLVDVPTRVNSKEEMDLHKLNYKQKGLSYNEQMENINILQFLFDQLIIVKTKHYEQLQLTLDLMKEEIELKRKIQCLEKQITLD